MHVRNHRSNSWHVSGRIVKMQKKMNQRERRMHLFQVLFGSEDRKDLALELCRAMGHMDDCNPEDIEIRIVEDFVFIERKREFLILFENLNLHETTDPGKQDLPLKLLWCAALLYEMYLCFCDRKNIMNEKAELPSLRLVVLHHGRNGEPANRILKLSELFAKCCWESEPDLKTQVHILNVDYKSGARILEECKPLRDYSFLVEAYRSGRPGKGDVRAVNDAIDEMEEGPVRDYLKGRRSEVIGMLITEYDEERAEQRLYQKAWEDGQKDGMEAGLREGLMEGMEKGRTAGLQEGHFAGLKEGERKGALKTLFYLVNRGTMTPQMAADCAGMSVAEFKRRCRRI